MAWKGKKRNENLSMLKGTLVNFGCAVFSGGSHPNVKGTKDNILVLFAKCPLSESYHGKMKMLLYHSSLITAFLWKLFKSQGCLQDQLLMKKIKASSVFIIVHLFCLFLLRSTSDGQMIRDCHHYHTWYLSILVHQKCLNSRQNS